jgi:hypothetical protein
MRHILLIIPNNSRSRSNRYTGYTPAMPKTHKNQITYIIYHTIPVEPHAIFLRLIILSKSTTIHASVTIFSGYIIRSNMAHLHYPIKDENYNSSDRFKFMVTTLTYSTNPRNLNTKLFTTYATISIRNE